MKQEYIKIPFMSHVLTYLLLIVTFMLGRDVFKSSYVIGGILFSTIGFSLSWFTKNKKNKIKQILTNAGYLGIVFFEIYKLLNSSFLFEDILLLTLEGVLIVQVIISFNSHSPRNLKCIQVLSLVTFLYLSLFTNTSSLMYIIPSILYFFIWSLIIKIQIQDKNKILSFSALPSYLIYFLILISALAAANLLQKNIVFNVQPAKKYTLETKRFDTPNRLYNLQTLLFKVTVISVDESPKDRKEIMRNVTSLFQKSPDIDKFEKANMRVRSFLQKHGPANIPGMHGVPGDDGLVDPLKRPGSGMEPWGSDAGVEQKRKVDPWGSDAGMEQKRKGKPRNDESNQSVSILKEYIDLKTDLKNKTARDSILDKVTSKDKTLKTKIKTLLSLNSIVRASTQKSMNRKINLLDKNIKALPLDNQTKEELNEMVGNLKKWKLYSIYNNLRNSLKEDLQDADKDEAAPDLSKAYDKTKSLKQDLQLKEKLLKEASDFIKKIEKAETAPDLFREYDKTKGLEQDLQLKEKLGKEASDFIKKIEKAKTASELSREYDKTKSLKQDLQLKEKLKKEVSDLIRKIEKTATASELSREYDKTKGLEQDLQLKEKLKKEASELIKKIEKTGTTSDLFREYDKIQDLEQDFQLKEKLLKETSDFIKKIEKAATTPDLFREYDKTKGLEQDLQLKEKLGKEASDFIKKIEKAETASELSRKYDKTKSLKQDLQLKEKLLKEASDFIKKIEKAATAPDLFREYDKTKGLEQDFQLKEKLLKEASDFIKKIEKAATAPDLFREYDKTKGLEQDFQLKKKLRKEVSDFIKKIEKAETASELSKLYKKMGGIKNVLNKAYPAQKNIFEKNLKAILETKLELNLATSADQLNKKITKELISQDTDKDLDSINLPKKIFDTYKAMLSAQEIGEFLEKLKKLEKQTNINKKALSLLERENWQKLTNSKIEMFDSKEKEGTKKTLEESLLSELNMKNFMKSVDDFSSQNQQDISRKKKEVSEEIQDLFRHGIIFKDTAHKLNNHLNNFSKIIEAENIARNLTAKKEKRSSDDYYEELKEFAELNIAGDKELKKDFDRLLDKMVSSYSTKETALLMKELENILNKAKLKNVLPSKIRDMKAKLNKLKEIKDKSFLSEATSSLINDLKTLKNITKKGKKQDALEKIIASLKENSLKGKKLDKDLIEKLKNTLDRVNLKSASLSVEKTLKKIAPAPLSWQVVVFPRRIVISKEEKAKIKVIGLYGSSIMKDLTREVSWTFENSSIAWINSEGEISAISPGRSKAVADYNGNKSYDVEIIVLEVLDQETTDLKKYLQ